MDVAQFKIALGTLPDWIGGIGTAAATLLLVVGLLREIRRRRLDDEQAALDRRNSEARQARLVLIGRARFDVIGGSSVTVLNESTDPIHDITPVAFWIYQGSPTSVVADRVGITWVAGPRRLGGGVSASLDVELTESVSLTGKWKVAAEIEFTDVEGRRWSRRGDAQPKPVNRVGSAEERLSDFDVQPPQHQDTSG